MKRPMPRTLEGWLLEIRLAIRGASDQGLRYRPLVDASPLDATPREHKNSVVRPCP